MGSKYIKREYFMLLFGAICLIFSVLLWWFMPSSTSLFEKLLNYSMLLFFSTMALLGLLYPLQNYFFFRFIYSIAKYVFMAIGYILIVLDVFLGPLFVIALLVLLQLILWKAVSVFVNTGGVYGIAYAYIISLCTIILLSYKGVWIINFFNTYIKREKNESNHLTLKFFSRLHFRRRAYEFTILLFILSTIESLINKQLFSVEIWSSFSKASLAILLTFGAIDTYVVNFMPNIISREREQLQRILSK